MPKIKTPKELDEQVKVEDLTQPGLGSKDALKSVIKSPNVSEQPMRAAKNRWPSLAKAMRKKI